MARRRRAAGRTGPAPEPERAALLAEHTDASERVYRGWHGFGYHHPEAGYVCAVFPRADEVLLAFERGVELEDPDGLLEGDGRTVRWARVTPPGEPPAVAAGETGEA